MPVSSLAPRRRVLAARDCLLAVILTTVGTVPAASAESGKITIDNFTFSPAELTVAPGTTVTWTNGDDIPHTVVSNDKVFRSKVLDTDDHFSFTFTKPGEYAYFCSIHPHMTGKVVVRVP